MALAIAMNLVWVISCYLAVKALRARARARVRVRGRLT